MVDRLVVQGAREHNLTGVDLDLPRDSLVVFTGLSGSGKSSLAFDTIFAEGQRRYVESLSAYARQFLGQMDKPDVDFIEGLSPAVSIDQKSTSRNPRSTVGTITEVYDYLRLLYARAGTPHCPTCGEIISKQTPQQIVDQVLDMEPGRRFQVLAPGHPRPQGRVRRPVQPAPGPGLLPRARRRHGLSAGRAADAEEAGEARHLGRGRPPVGEVERQAAPHRLGRDRAASRPRASSSSSSSTSPRTTRTASAASPSGWPARTATSSRWTTSSPAPSPSTRPTARAPRAPAWASRRRSTRSCWCPTTSSRSPTAPSPPGPSASPPSTSPGCSPRSPSRSASAWTRRGASSRRGCRRPCCTARTTRCTCATATATAASARTTRRSRASCRSSSAGSTRPSPTAPASATRATCATCRARRAAGRGSSRRSSR